MYNNSLKFKINSYLLGAYLYNVFLLNMHNAYAQTLQKMYT